MRGQSFWIEAVSSSIHPFYVAAGSIYLPFNWTHESDEAALFRSAEIAEGYLKRLGHSGIGVRIRQARSSLNGS